MLFITDQAASWTNAQAVCLKMGGTLAKVDSHAILQFIRSICRQGRAYKAYACMQEGRGSKFMKICAYILCSGVENVWL